MEEHKNQNALTYEENITYYRLFAKEARIQGCEKEAKYYEDLANFMEKNKEISDDFIKNIKSISQNKK